MDLNVCPDCNSFVGRDWTSCKSCGRQLDPKIVEATEEDQPVDETAQDETEPSSEVAEASVEISDPVAEDEQSSNATDPVGSKVADFPEETSEPVAEPQSDPSPVEPGNIIGESTLEWPKERSRFFSGQVFAVVGIIALVIVLLVGAVFLVTNTDDKPVLPQPTTTSTLVPQIAFNDPAGRFAATFPAEPVRSDYDFDGLKATQFTASLPDKQLTAVVIVADIPGGAKSTENEVELRETLKAFEVLYGHKLGSSIVVRDKDPWTLDATLTQNTLRTNYRLFVQNNRLFQVYVQAPEDTAGAPQTFSTLVDNLQVR